MYKENICNVMLAKPAENLSQLEHKTHQQYKIHNKLPTRL